MGQFLYSGWCFGSGASGASRTRLTHELLLRLLLVSEPKEPSVNFLLLLEVESRGQDLASLPV